MNRETRELVTLNADEVEKAIRLYVSQHGFKVPSYASVTGLDLGEAKAVVSVTVSKSSEQVPLVPAAVTV